MREIQELFAAQGKRPLVRPAARLSDISNSLRPEYSPLILSFSGIRSGRASGARRRRRRPAAAGGDDSIAPQVATRPPPPRPQPPADTPAAKPAQPANADALADASAPCFVNQISLSSSRRPRLLAQARRQRRSGAGGRRPAHPQAEPSVDAMIRLLSLARPRAQGIVFNACCTEPMARLIHRDLPSLAIVCWRSIVEDKAAKAFSRGFFAAIAEGAPGAVSVHRAFDAGRAAFLRAGYCEGDPAAYLHEPTHEHVRTRRFVRTCIGCKPPVHGQPCLVAKPRL